MSPEELIERFSLERVNASPAAWNYDKLNHFNGIYIRQLSVEDLTDRLTPFLESAGLKANREKMLKIIPLIQERIELLSEAPTAGDFYFMAELPPYDLNLLTPRKMTLADVPDILQKARATLAETAFNHEAIEANLRQATQDLGVKAGQMFQPIRVAVCGRKVAPPLFGTLEALGKETVLKRIDQAIALVNQSL
jgi:glutamyl-tRNA synthetase